MMPHKLLRCEAAPQFCKHSESAEFSAKIATSSCRAVPKVQHLFLQAESVLDVGSFGHHYIKVLFFCPE